MALFPAPLTGPKPATSESEYHAIHRSHELSGLISISYACARYDRGTAARSRRAANPGQRVIGLVACGLPGTAQNARCFRTMPTEFYFTSELHLKNGQVMGDTEDALEFARDQEPRPGVDQRDEVLHKMERANSKEETHAAAHLFLRWLEELEILE